MSSSSPDEAARYVVSHIRKQSVFKCHLYGRCDHDAARRTNEYEVHCCIGEPTAEAFVKFFDDILHESNPEDLFTSVHSVYFHDFDFEELPSNVGRVLRNVIGTCTFMNCSSLNSLKTTVTQFSHLSSIQCVGCASLVSLSSLAHIPTHVPIKSLFFKRCGLQSSAQDNWEEGMRAVALTRRGRYDYGRWPRRHCLFSFTVSECNDLISLPSSIGHLKDKDTDAILINIHNNRHLKRIPYDIGRLGKLKKIIITECPLIDSLPWTLGRVDGVCEVCMDYSMSNLKTVMQNAGAEVTEAFDDHDFECNTADLEPYFQKERRKFYRGVMLLAALLYRARIRAIDRLYCPGGEGFERCKEHYQKMRLEYW